jgi:septum formation protein
MPSSESTLTLILASASPRRQELLTQLGVPFSILPANIDEQHFTGESPDIYVQRMARTKAQYMAQQQPMAFVLGADTIVVQASHILGKPQDLTEACRTLMALSGRQHTVITALALCHHQRGFLQVETVQTQVWFRVLSPAEIEQYIATTEPFDKAGAYAIQGAGAAFVTAIEGCYTNAVGLPLRRTMRMLRAVGFAVSSPPPSVPPMFQNNSRVANRQESTS